MVPPRPAPPRRARSRAAAGRARSPPGRPPPPPRPTPGPWTGARSGPGRIVAAARSASVSPTISCPARLSRNRPGEPGGMVSAKCAASSNSASTASRSRSAAAPTAPPAADARCHCGASPEASQMAHSTSSALPPALIGGLGHRQQPGDPPGRPGHAVRERDEVPRVQQGLGEQRQRRGPARPPASASTRGTGAAGAGPGRRCRRAGRSAARPRSGRPAWPGAARSAAA